MSLLSRRKKSELSDVRCTDSETMAERELSAFFGAVTELFGPEAAKLSAEEWLHELSETRGLPNSMPEFRAITTKVLFRLAKRLHASFLVSEPQMA